LRASDFAAEVAAMNLWQRLTSAVSAHPEARDSARVSLAHAQGSPAPQPLDRQQLLQAVVDAAPVAITLLDELGQIVFANAGARALFFDNEPPEGKNLLRMLAHVPAPLRDALLSDADHVFTHESGGESETYHLAKRQLDIAAQPHSMLIVRHVTLELARQENAVLRKAIRVIHHEFANSLTPVISLLRSVRSKLTRPDATAKLEQMLTVIEDRVLHLNAFLTGFAALGRLPKPRLQEVRWSEFLAQLQPLLQGQSQDQEQPTAAPMTISDAPEKPGWFDPAQLQQVLINLVKNAREAGSPEHEIALEVLDVAEGGQRVSVLDRGAGMSGDVFENAMVPSFTTRPNGSGMGLSLCREIADAHHGHLRITRREGGGMHISVWLPPREPAPSGALTLSRAHLSLSRQ
jgi:two-component system, NtrC family, nitrogen regulation sensor histidine kinase NtrY